MKQYVNTYLCTTLESQIHYILSAVRYPAIAQASVCLCFYPSLMIKYSNNISQICLYVSRINSWFSSRQMLLFYMKSQYLSSICGTKIILLLFGKSSVFRWTQVALNFARKHCFSTPTVLGATFYTKTHSCFLDSSRPKSLSNSINN